VRRIFSLILTVILLISLSGCHYSDSSNDILEPVEFYYLRSSESFVYGSADGVIASEVREASGHTNDLTYLLSMYLPQEAQKSLTAALVALGGVVSRPATDAVEIGSQIADRFSIISFSGKQKRTRFQCFHIS